MINNVSQIVEALGGAEVIGCVCNADSLLLVAQGDQDVYVSLISIGNCLGSLRFSSLPLPSARICRSHLVWFRDGSLRQIAAETWLPRDGGRLDEPRALVPQLRQSQHALPRVSCFWIAEFDFCFVALRTCSRCLIRSRLVSLFNCVVCLLRCILVGCGYGELIRRFESIIK